MAKVLLEGLSKHDQANEIKFFVHWREGNVFKPTHDRDIITGSSKVPGQPRFVLDNLIHDNCSHAEVTGIEKLIGG